MNGLPRRLPMPCLLAALALLLGACAKDIPRFVPPAERPLARAEQPWPANQLLTLAYHDIEDADPDQGFLSVQTDQLVAQLAWLRENGYAAVSVDQILEARRGGQPLPPKAVLLSFDDGYRSFYTRVWPILQAYGWPAVLAPVGRWMDTPAGEPVDFGGKPVERERFLTWEQIAEMARSNLVEIGAHTDNLHFGTVANPQGNQQPAATVLRYDAQAGGYESPGQYRARLEADVRAISDKLRRGTGKQPRVWVWPYGAANGAALSIIEDEGYAAALTLEAGLGRIDALESVPRILLSGDGGLGDVAGAVAGVQETSTLRVAHVDLDYLYDPDPAQVERNIGALVQRIADLQISAVFLQAFSDPDGSGLVRQVYFPNRVLGMRADLFSRVAWQLRSRAKVKIFAWMPVLGLDLDPALPRVLKWAGQEGKVEVDAGQYRRLSPFDPAVRQRIGMLYEDLARHAWFDGILYHDDAILSDYEDAGPAALAAYREAGLGDDLARLRADPELLRRWTRFKSRYLVDFTHELTAKVRAIRGPQVLTARNIFAGPVVAPESEAWFAQNLDDFLGAYDWTAPMAMPLMEEVPPRDTPAWLDRLADAVASRPGALDKTVFELQARDWRNGEPVDGTVLAGWMERLQLRGARHFGYYPDDTAAGQPALDAVRPVISNAWFPVR